jgi:hypothetical protein
MSKVSSETTRLCWNGLLDTFKIHDLFTHIGKQGSHGVMGKLARFMKFYILSNRGEDIIDTSYFIRDHFVGSNLSHVQLELCISFEDIRRVPFK